MIKLLDRGQEGRVIRFTPRSGFKNAPVLECDLISGYVCPICDNVFRATFYADKQVNLSLYEETRVIGQGTDNTGIVVRFIPDDQHSTALRDEYFAVGSDKVQRITLKNHVLNPEGCMGARDRYFETGARCCSHSALIPMREDTFGRELWPMVRSTRYGQTILTDREALNQEPTAEFIKRWIDIVNPAAYSSYEFRFVPATGEGPFAFLVRRNWVKKVEEPYLVKGLYDRWDAELKEIADRETEQALLAVELEGPGIDRAA